MTVDIGVEAINRSSLEGFGKTIINRGATASEAGNVTSIDIYVRLDKDITGLIVGIFYATNGNTLKCRSAQAIAGTITGGSKVSKVVSLSVEIGDYIGCYFTGGELERDRSGYAGYWTKTGEYIDVDDEATYSLLSGDAISLGGYLAVAAAGRSFGFIIG